MDQAHVQIETPEGVRHVQMGDEPLSFGRHPDNTVVITDQMASRHHCVIERNALGYQVRDLSSRNGTRVNGVPIAGSKGLEPGDIVNIGSTDLQLFQPGSGPLPLVPNEQTEAVERKAPVLKGVKRPQSRDAAPAASKARRGDAEPVSDADDPAILGQHLRELHDMVMNLPHAEFDEADIQLVNARGQTVHGDTESQSKKKGAEGATAATVRMMRMLLLACFRIRATDIHMEPRRNDAQVRLRVDGLMVEIARLNTSVTQRLMSIIKVLADIDIAQKSVIQEGHFSTGVPGRVVDYRVSFTPSMYGQKLVIRVLDQQNAPHRLEDLELPDWMYETVRNTVRQDAGMVLSCGPTGSGKTTTLYAAIREVDAEVRNIITIEDPVEYQIEGVTQIPISEDQGNTFATLLRSVLRQDPDVILLGEVRDEDTARVAMQAAVTGHMVFSTVHARDTLGSIFRLMDLGVEPYLVASGLNLVLAQRLVRMLCPSCKVDTKPTSAQSLRMSKYVSNVTTVYIPAGCEHCLQTGYVGRRAIFELLRASEDVQDVILKNPTLQDLRRATETDLFNSLTQSGYRLVSEGLTSVDEIDRVAGGD
ncbi:MAG: secretion system protein E [Planctomycetaceae bacterium]|nr:secretion system protein E [Planctomycetaceae bacterium]